LIDDTQDADTTNNHKEVKKSKPTLMKGSQAWTKAVKYLQEGGAIEDIQAKYSFSKDELLKDC
jgi:hypothetical protein